MSNKTMELIAVVRGRKANLMHVEETIPLSTFYTDETQTEKTPYQRFREKVKQVANSLIQLFHIELIIAEALFVSGQPVYILPIVRMKGGIEWLDKVEFFLTYVGTGGGSSEQLLPSAVGLLDYDKRIRIEVNHGAKYPIIDITKI